MLVSLLGVLWGVNVDWNYAALPRAGPRRARRSAASSCRPLVRPHSSRCPSRSGRCWPPAIARHLRRRLGLVLPPDRRASRTCSQSDDKRSRGFGAPARGRARRAALLDRRHLHAAGDPLGKIAFAVPRHPRASCCDAANEVFVLAIWMMALVTYTEVQERRRRAHLLALRVRRRTSRSRSAS